VFEPLRMNEPLGMNDQETTSRDKKKLRIKRSVYSQKLPYLASSSCSDRDGKNHESSKLVAQTIRLGRGDDSWQAM
jgi:hypothetical protein